METVGGHEKEKITYIVHKDGVRGPVGHSNVGTHCTADTHMQSQNMTIRENGINILTNQSQSHHLCECRDQQTTTVSQCGSLG